MLRNHRTEDIAEQVETVAIAVPLSPTEEQEKEPFRQLDDEFLWLLLLAAVAECVTTCYIPGYTLHKWELNVGGTLLNWIGPFLDGVSYGYEDYLKGVEVSVACMQFRSAFLGYATKDDTIRALTVLLTKLRDGGDRVFTSYSFMVDHAGDLSSANFSAGPLYVCASIGGGCGCFYLGKQVAAAAWIQSVFARMGQVVGRIKSLPSLATCLAIFVGMTTLRAALGPHGFVRDPKDPQFIGPQQVADGEELVLGIFMSCSAVLLSNFICEFFPRQPPQLRTAASRSGGPFTDWGCLCCNLLASVLAGVTYQLSRISSTGVTNNLLALKFVSSFCGSLSMFSTAVNIISRLWLSGNRQSAVWNFSLQLLVGLVCIPYLYKHDAT